MILLDTSIYIAAAEFEDIERLVEQLATKHFIQSCDVVQVEVHNAAEFLRKTHRKALAERLRLIYDTFPRGTITTTENVFSLAKEYRNEAQLSRKKDAKMSKDFLIVASAAIAGIKAIGSFNRKTMADPGMQNVYKRVNTQRKLNTPLFFTTMEDLRKLLEAP